MTPATTDDLTEALRAAQRAAAVCIPVNPRQHVAQVLALSGWLGEWRNELGAAALRDLEQRLVAACPSSEKLQTRARRG